MTPAALNHVSSIDDGQLWSLLKTSAVAGRLHNGCTMTGVRRAPGAYRSSFPIEDVEVTFDDGSSRWLVLKDVSPGAMLPAAGRAKPAFLYDPRREIETYRHILGPYGVGAPALVAAVADEARQCYVLLLEKVAGVPLWQVGEIEAWAQAARWLAAMHQRLSYAAPALIAPARLLCYDCGYYARWRERAERCDNAAPGMMCRLLRAYDRVVSRLLELPRTVIHGEFHASNIVVQSATPSVRVRPVDWETAGAGPGLMDLADLTAGNWTRGECNRLAEAYRARLATPMPSDQSHFERDLDCCRFHRAMQWMSWSNEWTPPREHGRDWLGEAMIVAERLRVL